MPPKITADVLFDADSVVFDLDGTLFDSAYDVATAYCVALPKFGFEPPPPETLRIGPPAEAMVHEMIGQDAAPELVTAIADEFRRNYDVSDYPVTTLYPGALELLNRLKSEGIRLSIATYKRAVSTRRLLEIKGVADLFDVVLTIEGRIDNELGVVPPTTNEPGPVVPTTNEPGPVVPVPHWTKHRMLTSIMEKTRTSPERTIFFGDSVGDIEAGRELSVKTVAVLYGYEPAEDLLALRPDYVCENLTELFALRG